MPLWILLKIARSKTSKAASRCRTPKIQSATPLLDSSLILRRLQPQADRQRFAEHLTLLVSFQFENVLDHANPVALRRLGFQHVEHVQTMAVVDVNGALTALA